MPRWAKRPAREPNSSPRPSGVQSKLSSSVPSQRVTWRTAPPVALAISTSQLASGPNRAKAMSRPFGDQLGKRSEYPSGVSVSTRAGALPDVCTLIALPWRALLSAS
ncbi:hypothetical protein D3C71_981310 [compost metagenome]